MSIRKRRRVEDFPVRARQRRPVDKELVVTNQTCTTSAVATILKTTTFPCTVVGLRWSLAFVTASATAAVQVNWMIVVVPDGEAVNTPVTSDGGDAYTPEQNVMAFGVIRLSESDLGGPVVVNIEGSTKSMRKLKQGDVLDLVTLCSDANGASLDGIVQFFCKT